MQNYLSTQPAPAALPLEYSIDAVASTPDWIYELRWRDQSLDTFYSIGDAVNAGLEHVAFVQGGYFDEADCAAGDIHGALAAQWEEEARPIAELELAMLDSCLGAPYSDGEAGCILVELESQGVYVEPVACADCGRTHLVRAARGQEA